MTARSRAAPLSVNVKVQPGAAGRREDVHAGPVGPVARLRPAKPTGPGTGWTGC